MDVVLVALADPARWRLVELLAERPRPVGVLAELAGARQPQTTKHLQTLERAGIVASERSGQRRIYALRPGPLRSLASLIAGLADTAERAGGPLETYGEYRRAVLAERDAADKAGAGWADGRSLRFRRSVAAPPALLWRHLTEAALLARWWAPDDLRVSELVFEARPGGRIVQEYRDADDTQPSAAHSSGAQPSGAQPSGSEPSGIQPSGSEPSGAQPSGSEPDGAVVGRAVGVVEAAEPGARLAYRMTPLLPGGAPAFTAHVEMVLTPVGAGTELGVDYRITGSAVDSADFIAGIEIGFGQSLDKLTAVFESGSTK
ncbi:metalloregulator ArsR/SmtB family transcription factor [Paractinoplanes deccanensis]|nr:metalloregulator ArsR/SmtB family transcription factor [Actinoplanes deccanensis]